MKKNKINRLFRVAGLNQGRKQVYYAAYTIRDGKCVILFACTVDWQKSNRFFCCMKGMSYDIPDVPQQEKEKALQEYIKDHPDIKSLEEYHPFDLIRADVGLAEYPD